LDVKEESGLFIYLLRREILKHVNGTNLPWTSAFIASIGTSNATIDVLMMKPHFHNFVEASSTTEYLFHFFCSLFSWEKGTFFWFPLTLVVWLPVIFILDKYAWGEFMLKIICHLSEIQI
jgi:hypothetical protein